MSHFKAKMTKFDSWCLSVCVLDEVWHYRPIVWMWLHPVAAPAFLSVEAKGWGRHFRGQVYMVANTYFYNTGHILHYSKFPSLSLDLSFLFASCDSFPFHLSFIPISRPSPPFIQLGVWGSAVSSPSGSGRSPAAKWTWVNSGSRNERFLTCKSGKLQCSLDSLIHFVLIQ